MSEAARGGPPSEEEGSENLDKAVEEAKDLEFATLEEVVEAFRS
jgi:hypothetical protein